MVSAQVVWEDYQGTYRITGTSGQDLAGPNYPNGTGTSEQRLDALRTISANPANAVRTGTSVDINYRTTSLTLCNLDSDTAGTGAACQADAQGRVIYGILRLPYSGSYSFSLAHDDDIDVDFSTAYGSANYRAASYDVAIGSASEYTADDSTYEALTGTVVAPSANSCVLLRLYWNNVGGINHLRLRWTRPNSNGSLLSTIEFIPAANFMPPGTTTGCAGSVTTTGRSLTLNKLVGATGRAGASDQFTVSVLNDAGTTLIASATTAGAGTGQQASTGANFVTAGVTYRMTDAMASGSSFTLGAYTPSIACTLNGAAFTTTNISTGIWSLTVPLIGINQQFICNITNSRASRQLQLRKSWSGAVVGHAVTIPPTTDFSTNTAALNAVADAATDTDTGTAITVLTGMGTLPAEQFTNVPASRYASVLSCSDGTLSGTDGQASNQLTIAATGATIICTYANSYRPPLTVSKTSMPFWDPVNISSNPKMIPGGLVNYTIAVTSPSAYVVTSDSIVIIDELPPSVGLFVNSIGGSPAGPIAFTPGSSGLTFSFASLSSPTDDVDFSNNGGISWTYQPVADANGIDSNVTHIRLRPKGSMAASTGFQFGLRTKIK